MLAEMLARRIERYLTCRGYLTRDAEYSYLADRLTDGWGRGSFTKSCDTNELSLRGKLPVFHEMSGLGSRLYRGAVIQKSTSVDGAPC